MPTYIMLADWTEEGIRAVKDSPTRVDAAKQGAKALGYEAPSDDVAARFTLQRAMGGNVRTRMLKAFPEADLHQIVGSLG